MHESKTSVAGVCAGAILLAPWPAALAQDNPPPQAQPPGSGVDDVQAPASDEDVALAANAATVVSVEGPVQVIPSPGADPIVPTVGKTLKQGALIRTGPSARIMMRIGDGQVFTIGSNSKVSLAQMIKRLNTEGRPAGDGETVPETIDDTALDIEYGDAYFDVNSLDFANDVKLVGPDSTLDVTGTRGGYTIRGRRVRAFGGEMNTGRFFVRYQLPGGKRAQALVTGEAETTSETPNPAARAVANATQTTGSDKAREDSETKQNARSAGGATEVRTGVGLTRVSQPPDVRDDIVDMVVENLPDFEPPFSPPSPPPPPPPPPDRKSVV